MAVIARLVEPVRGFEVRIIGRIHDQRDAHPGQFVAYRDNVRQPLLTGLAGFRKARREALARQQELAGRTYIVRVDLMKLRRVGRDEGTHPDSISMVLTTITTHVNLS